MKILPIALFSLFSSLVQASDHGVSFSCPSSDDGRASLVSGVSSLLSGYGISPGQVVMTETPSEVEWALSDEVEGLLETSLEISSKLGIPDEFVDLRHETKHRWVKTVSKKEIAMALLMRGRKTVFAGCSPSLLSTHIDLRQMTVAWAEDVDWEWPDGKKQVMFDRKLWNAKRLSPKKGKSLEAVVAPFFESYKYRFGCQVATQIVYANAVLNYFSVRNRDASKLKSILTEMDKGKDPLERFEHKYVVTMEGVSPDNFVPGDWIYLTNTDKKSHAHYGYEGSNAVYLGRNKFDDYYNDNDHSYSMEEKLDAVWQWRHSEWVRKSGTVVRKGDDGKKDVLDKEDFRRLVQPPEQGGLLSRSRTFVSPDLGLPSPDGSRN